MVSSAIAIYIDMKKTWLTICLLLACIDSTSASSDVEVESALADAARIMESSISQQPPNVYPRLVSFVAGPGRQIVMTLSHQSLAGEWSEEMKEAARKKLLHGYCTGANYAYFRDEGVAAKYVALDRVGTLISRFSIEVQNCKK
jgi:hypothetical protein